jgi:hypothetical protein
MYPQFLWSPLLTLLLLVVVNITAQSRPSARLRTRLSPGNGLTSIPLRSDPGLPSPLSNCPVPFDGTQTSVLAYCSSSYTPHLRTWYTLTPLAIPVLHGISTPPAVDPEEGHPTFFSELYISHYQHPYIFMFRLRSFPLVGCPPSRRCSQLDYTCRKKSA